VRSFVPTAQAVAATPDAPGYFTRASGMSAAIEAGDLNNGDIVTPGELNYTLTNYWANNPWLLLTNVAGLGGPNVTFDLTSEIEGNYSVLYSTSFTDSNAPAVPQGFYRRSGP
jgi:hypothetical protein